MNIQAVAKEDIEVGDLVVLRRDPKGEYYVRKAHGETRYAIAMRDVGMGEKLSISIGEAK